MADPLVLVPTRPDDMLLEACSGLRLLRLDEQDDPDAALAEHGAAVTAVANPGEGPLGADLLDRLPNLQIISHFGVGYETVDVDAAVERGIVVTNVGGSNDEEVADIALSLLLMTVRELGRAERYLRAGRWEAEGPFPSCPTSLRGRRLGLLGIGAIGQAIARRAQAFGLEVAYHARTERPDLDLQYVGSLLELAHQVDVLVVAVPGGPATRHLVDAEVLAALGPHGVLVNIARGSVVDQGALVHALRSGALLGAGLDVFEDEPHVPEELLALDGAVLLPHVGSASVPTRRDMAALGARNLTAWFEDRTVLTPVPEARGLAERVQGARAHADRADADRGLADPAGADRTGG